MSTTQQEEPVQKSATETTPEAVITWYSELKRANDLWRSNPGDNGGRDGVLLALETVLKFLGECRPVLDEALQTPLVRLFNDLMALDDNNVSSLLKPTPRSGRAPSSAVYEALKGTVAYTRKRLVATGLSVADANSSIAKQLNDSGMNPARKGSDGAYGEFSDRTVKDWCQDVSNDVGRSSEAASTCDELEKEFTKEILELWGLPCLPENTNADKLLAELPASKDTGLGSLRAEFLGKLKILLERMRASEVT